MIEILSDFYSKTGILLKLSVIDSIIFIEFKRYLIIKGFDSDSTCKKDLDKEKLKLLYIKLNQILMFIDYFTVSIEKIIKC